MCYLLCVINIVMCVCHCLVVGARAGEHRALQRFLLSPLQAAPQTAAAADPAHGAMDLSQVSELAEEALQLLLLLSTFMSYSN